MNIHLQFVKLGSDRRKLTNELLALLPEIYEKGIYKKYAATVVEYAGKFGGLSKGVVLKRLRLEKYLKDKPSLMEAIKSGGVHKVGLVAKLATAETENLWLDKVRNMSKMALQELSKEVRCKMEMGEMEFGVGVNQSLFGERENCKTTLCGASPQRIKVELEGELFFMFLKLKKKYGEKLTNREVMKKIFEETLGGEKVSKMEKDGGNVNPQPIKSIPGDNFEGELVREEVERKPITRYIPKVVKQKVVANSHGFCTYPNCNRPAEIFHHMDRFANSRNHESLTPVCKIHHEFMHNGLVKNELSESKNWSLQLGEAKLQKIDQLYREYRLNFRW